MRFRINQCSRILGLVSCAVVSVMMQGCVTTPSTMVLERADDLNSAPSWASFSKPQRSDDNNVRFLGYVEVPGDSLKSAAFNMSDEKALSEPTRSLVDAFLEQNQVGEELRADASFGRRIISATSGYRPAIPSLHITQRYYEVVVIKSGVGEDQTRLRVWSLAEANRHDFDRARANYLRRLNGEPEVKKILDDVGARQINQVTKADNKNKPKADTAKTAPSTDKDRGPADPITSHSESDQSDKSDPADDA